ncbi:MAG: single-stranded-DNA-specific exonuclease RecJ [Candidatus Omnitrophota bacterium]|nr:single-stranded-DNA-specific exonuclease RecJ [Candidatus Omnitrophota bacterium]
MKILKIAGISNSLQNTISKELGISKILAQVLINRKILTVNDAQKFLKAAVGHLLDPYSFSDMSKAVHLIKGAAAKKEKVMIFGDYDADGITSVALLKDMFLRLGTEALHYLPHRIKEGYGLNKNALDFAKQKNIKVLITVDCGISNHEEIKEFKRCGIEVIVTDHHEPLDEALPKDTIIINPKLKGSGYKYRDLAGVGVAYKVACAVCGSMLLTDLDLVCLGTIADSAPLTGENRVIAKEGLSRLPQTKRLGLQMLIDSAGITNKKFNSTSISFILAPRINASGRMDSPQASLDLLLSQEQDEAARLAKVLEGYNRQRQKVESRILEEAQDIIGREVNFKEHKVIVIAGENWHQGVLGIVASKIADKFYRPAIVVSLQEGLCKGSARSIESFHILDALLNCKESLDSFGGHSHAAGLLIHRDNIEGFRHNINRLAHQNLTVEDLLPNLDIDMELNLSDLSERVALELEFLEPFGKGNPEPLFYTRNLKLKTEPQVLGRGALKFCLTDGDIIFTAIGFKMSHLKDSIKMADNFDLVYTLKMDTWGGQDSIILEAKDIILRG